MMSGKRIVSGLLAVIVMAIGSFSTAQEQDATSWPKTLADDKYEVTIYQPQIEAFQGNQLESRSAISVKSKSSGERVFGAMWFDSRLETDHEKRLATLVEVNVTGARFPDVEQEKVDRLSRALEREIPKWELVMSLDQLLADLADDDEIPQGDRGFKNEPPVIHVRTTPAVLVVVDGDPVFTDMSGYELEYVANSAFFIVRDMGSKRLYLRGAGLWFAADDPAGPWAVTEELPAEVMKVSKKVEEEEALQAEEASEDAEALGKKAVAEEAPPEIILTTVPAELILTDGEMDFATVEGTQLLYLSNTESDVLMDIDTQQYYVLLAGRWYRSLSVTDGPWEFVPFDDLPEAFGSIPADSDMATVLPSVAGTRESREAVLETQIPQTAEVDRKTATCEVTWDGDPEFESCGEGVAYGLNTDKSVLLIDNRYYCVDSAVWFVADGPDGPWRVATEVPAVVQDLPPDCPVYNVKYVYIYETTPEVVYVGYTSGYYGSYVYGPCVVYGTGWYYRPWWRHYYYPRPVTYGYGVHYNPYTGWGFSFGVSYGWLTIGVGWGRPPYGCWGPAGYRYGYRHGYWRGYNRGYAHGYRRGAAAGYRAGYRAGQKQPRGSNIYRDRPNGVKRTGDVASQGRRRPATSDRRNDVYTDRDGNVYRDRDGTWEQRDKGEWSREDRERDSDRSREDRERDQDRSRERDRDADRNRDRDSADRSREADRSRDSQQADRQQRDRDQGVDRSRDRSRGTDRQQLDRDRSSRNRGNERQRQAPSRGGGAGARRSGGGRR